nr:TWiK family of potassium channels protein 7-like [Procambarus clarkii]
MCTEEANKTGDQEGVWSEWWQRLRQNKQIRKAVGHVSLLLLLLLYTGLGAKVFQSLEHEVEQQEQQQLWTQLHHERQRLIRQLSNFTNSQQYHQQPQQEQSPPREQHQQEQHQQQEQQEPEENQTVTEGEFGVTAETVSKWLGRYEEVLAGCQGSGVYPLQEEINPRWTYTQALFFSATVLTTIGYGNIAPSTVGGRVFCMIFALVGIPLTLSVIANMGDVLASLVPVAALDMFLPKGKLRAVVTVVSTLSLLVAFIALGGALFMFLDQWTFTEAFYFSFITTTTIGFGDLVPATSSLLCCTLYIMVGLALTSTVIELVRRQYASSWEHMKQLYTSLHSLTGPLAEAMRKLAESGSGQVEVDEALVRELRDLNVALAKAQKEQTGAKEEEAAQVDDPWTALLNLTVQGKKRITVVMYESHV